MQSSTSDVKSSWIASRSRELYPLLMQNVQRSLALYQHDGLTPAHLLRLTLIVRLLEGVTCVAAGSKDRTVQMSKR